ncbi:hypothetical protein [Duganella radicis]|uniref:Uncharacterized protein n=1 Tax=Duganella radicis TaxID=551988 RepID=A0A6L6PB68_9BURK|nr:hypothetical protein [Duganella radicis]MTV36326.1 hypothetical protein [Duganella radicis]
MSRYLRLFTLVISHEYLADMPGNMRFVPSAACAALMEREGLLLRHTPHGAELWREERALPASDALLPLAFAVFSCDPQLQYCTDWPVAPPLRYVSNGGDELLRAETLAGSGAARQPLLSVEIDHRQGARGDTGHKTYRIALASKKIHWKYFFTGNLAGKKLSIVDLDAPDGDRGIGFAASAMPATEDGTAYTSEGPLPMQRLPQQRLQLREEGGAGKVLIRRLPNANMEKLGKERGRDGRSMIVAEIYIHQ